MRQHLPHTTGDRALLTTGFKCTEHYCVERHSRQLPECPVHTCFDYSRKAATLQHPSRGGQHGLLRVPLCFSSFASCTLVGLIGALKAASAECISPHTLFPCYAQGGYRTFFFLPALVSVPTKREEEDRPFVSEGVSGLRF